MISFSKIFGLEENFGKRLMHTAIPIALQSVMHSLVMMADNQMVSSLGEDVLAAVSLAGQVFFIVLLAFFGLGSGASVFFSRFYGAKEDLKIKQTLSLALMWGLVLAVLANFISYVWARPILHLLSSSNHLTDLGLPFLTITSFSMPMVVVSVIIFSYFRSIFKSHYPMWISFFCLIVDIVLNYGLIFGNLGLPKMGVAGAAWATFIARFSEMILLLAFFISHKNPIRFKLRDCFLFASSQIASLRKHFIKTIIPLIIADLNWVLAITVYKASYAIAGEGVVAAFTAVDSIFQVFMVIFYGLGSACSIFIGEAIGERKLERAMQLGRVFIILNFLVAIPLGGMFALLAPYVPVWFSFSESTALIARQGIYLCAIFLSIRTLEFFMTVGILRGGGDSQFFLWVQTITLWIIGVPLVYIAAKYWHASPMVILLLVYAEEVLRDLFCYFRFKTAKWIHIFK